MSRFVKQIAFFIVGLVLTLLLMEVFIRSTHIVEQSYNDVYEDIGRGRRASYNYMMFNEGFSIGRFNRYRYLGPGYSPAKEDNVLRIALLGDSFVEGFQVFERHHFRRVLEEQLSRFVNRKVEVLNFGRSGFDIGDMYAYNKTFVSEFNPDYTLFFVSDADFYPLFTDPLRLKVRKRGDSLIVEKGFPKEYIALYNQTKGLIQHSSFFNMLNNGRKTIQSEGVGPILLEDFYPSSSTETKPLSKKTQEIPAITRDIFSHLDQTNALIINRDIAPLDTSKLALIRSNKLRYIDLTDTLNVLKTKGVNPHYWRATKKMGHWNQAAHKAVGEYLATHLAVEVIMAEKN